MELAANTLMDVYRAVSMKDECFLAAQLPNILVHREDEDLHESLCSAGLVPAMLELAQSEPAQRTVATEVLRRVALDSTESLPHEALQQLLLEAATPGGASAPHTGSHGPA